MAYIIYKRISDKTDPFLGNLHSGFGKGRSTVDPLYCVRRLQDIVERGRDRLILILLDWEKAFDKVDQAEMFEALERLNIPDEVIRMINAMYKDPFSECSRQTKQVNGNCRERASGKAAR